MFHIRLITRFINRFYSLINLINTLKFGGLVVLFPSSMIRFLRLHFSLFSQFSVIEDQSNNRKHGKHVKWNKEIKVQLKSILHVSLLTGALCLIVVKHLIKWSRNTAEWRHDVHRWVQWGNRLRCETLWGHLVERWGMTRPGDWRLFLLFRAYEEFIKPAYWFTSVLKVFVCLSEYSTYLWLQWICFKHFLILFIHNSSFILSCFKTQKLISK